MPSVSDTDTHLLRVYPIFILDWSVPVFFPVFLSPFPFPDEETDMDVHDRGMLYYRLLKHDVAEVSVTSWVAMVMKVPWLLQCCGMPVTLLFHALDCRPSGWCVVLHLGTSQRGTGCFLG